MKKTFLLFIATLTSLIAVAESFSFYHEGNVLFYNVLSKTDYTCEVAKSPYVFNDLVIPDYALDSSTGIYYKVVSIAFEAFYRGNFTSVTFPETLETIGQEAFSSLQAVTSVTFPRSLKKLENRAFADCKTLKSVVFDDCAVSIGEKVFGGCYNLESLDLGNSVTEIGVGSFENCRSLKDFIIPESVNSIGESAFYECVSLHNLSTGNGVKDIGDSAFAGCTQLNTVVLGNNIDKIYIHAFWDCTFLTTVDLGPSVKHIYNGAFAKCVSLKTIKGGESLKTIRKQAFSNCYKLAEYEIPNSVREIQEEAFGACHSLKKLTLPLGLETLGANILQSSENVTAIECPLVTPLPFNNIYPFSSDDYQRITLYVPAESVTAYMTTFPWSPFSNIEGKIFSGINDVEVDSATDEIDLNSPYEMFDLVGRRISGNYQNAPEGIYIIRQGSKTKKIVKNI